MENTITDTPVFDANSRYQWSSSETFPVTGDEWGLNMSALAQIVNTKGFQEDLDKANRTIAIYQLYQLAQKQLKAAVESGHATPIVPEQPVTNGSEAHPEHQMD